MENNSKPSFLKKGNGKLASDYHGKTKFSLQRLKKIIDEQINREKIHFFETDYNNLAFVTQHQMNYSKDR
jgi:hypothetical protein